MCTNPCKVIAPIRSRCLCLRVAAPTVEEVSSVLLAVAQKEGVKCPPALAERMRALDGDVAAVRACGLDHVAALCDAQLRHGASAREGCGLHIFVYDSEGEVRELLEALASRYGWRLPAG